MDNGTKTRTIILAVALINQFLVSFDKSPLPFNNIELEQLLSSLFTFAASLIAWYKNNYITKKGRLQKEVLQQSNLTRS